MSSAPKAIFLSYASRDADAARRICEALRGRGLEVWFDQSELRGGDVWEARIRRQIKEMIADHAHVFAYQIAELLGWRGEKDRAFEWLERAYAQRDPGMAHLKTDPFLDPLRGDPRWPPLLGKMGL